MCHGEMSKNGLNPTSFVIEIDETWSALSGAVL